MKFMLETLDDLMIFSQVSKLWEILKFSIGVELFDLVGKEGIVLNHLAKRIGCDTKKLLYAIHVLALSGLIEINNDYIKNSELANRYLTNQYHNKISDLLLYNAKTSFTEKRYREILELKSDQALISGDSLYMSAMNIGSKYVAVKIASKLLKGEHKTLLDLGCGSGIFSITACKYNKTLKSVCVDRKNILLILEKKIKALTELEGRISLVEGDILSPKEDESKFDYILLSNVLHFFQPEEIIKVLSNCHRRLKEGGRLIINDIFPSSDNLLQLLFSLEWLANGCVFIGLPKLKKMLKQSGYSNILSIKDKKIPTNLIVAEI